MKHSVCPECGARVPFGTYLTQMWLVRITCPGCKKRVRVRGTLIYYLIFVPIAGLVGWGGRQAWVEQGILGLLPILAGMGLAATLGLMAGLATWMRLEKE